MVVYHTAVRPYREVPRPEFIARYLEHPVALWSLYAARGENVYKLGASV